MRINKTESIINSVFILNELGLLHWSFASSGTRDETACLSCSWLNKIQSMPRPPFFWNVWLVPTAISFGDGLLTLAPPAHRCHYCHWKWSFLYPMILRVRTPHTSPKRRRSLGEDAWKTCSSRLWNRVFTNKYHHIPSYEKCWKQWFHSEQIYRTSFLHSQTRKMQSPWFLSSYRV